MKKYFSSFSFLLLLIVAIAGCAQTKQYTPQFIKTQYHLRGIPADLVRVHVNDLRGEKVQCPKCKSII